MRCYQAGLAHLDMGDELAAQAAFAEALTLDDSLAVAHYQAGNSLRRSGDRRSAEQALKGAIVRDPSLKDAYISLAFLYRSQGQTDAAASMLLSLIATHPTDDAVYTQVASLLTEMGCHAEVIPIYQAYLRLNPHAAQVYLKLGQSYQKLGRFEDAEKSFMAAIEQDGNTDAAYLLLAHSRRLRPKDSPLIERFEAVLNQPQISMTTRTCLHFSLGKMYDDLGNYDQAFEHFRIANNLHHQHVKFNPQALADYVNEIKRVFTKKFFQEKLPLSMPSPRPIFIVGMPRSGTTLIERILTGHPQVQGLGETELIDSLAEQLAKQIGLPYPACVEKLCDATADALAAGLRNQWSEQMPSAEWFVDKNPLNFLHVGLISVIVPGSQILHCIRNPLDTCVSIYFQYFAHTRNNYAYDLSDIAAFYAGYEVLMEHWRSVLPDRLFPVHYEKLIHDPKAVSRELYAKVGLDWTRDVILPNAKNGAAISTASVWQARQPIYMHSIERWRHYEKHLAPLSAALEENRVSFKGRL